MVIINWFVSLDCFDGEEIPASLFLAIQKAFESISHLILFSKLNDLGVHRKASDLVKSYLSEITQVTLINITASSSLPLIVIGWCSSDFNYGPSFLDTNEVKIYSVVCGSFDLVKLCHI